MKNKSALVSAINKELRIRAVESQGIPISTIYFGGGTPSVLSPSELDSILDSIHHYYNLNQLQETTIEVNPDDVTPDFILHLKSTIINRLSIGVQSFHNEDLIWMNRSHNASQSINAIESIISAGYHNITIDLIYGLPNSNDELWYYNLKKIIEYKIPHFSAYALTVEENTSLHHQILTKHTLPIDEDQAAHQMQMLLEFTRNNDYEAYEISNFAKQNSRAIHNSNYWNNVPYIGIGPSAHSYDGTTRRSNVANNNLYITNIVQNLSYHTTEILTDQNKFNEYVMVNLRKCEGLNKLELKERFPLWYNSTIAQLDASIINGNIITKKNAYILTDQGRLYADIISSNLFIV